MIKIWVVSRSQSNGQNAADDMILRLADLLHAAIPLCSVIIATELVILPEIAQREESLVLAPDLLLMIAEMEDAAIVIEILEADPDLPEEIETTDTAVDVVVTEMIVMAEIMVDIKAEEEVAMIDIVHLVVDHLPLAITILEEMTAMIVATIETKIIADQDLLLNIEEIETETIPMIGKREVHLQLKFRMVQDI
eukprot:CAMPEP_0176368116 /NCGR_PEP_ID=MMETSP0126-20121128/22370_1 /TAXON_ID=141414 ORGANISM="Strombidinopsis acuminatum, Strain SPMC142" /NCGR_SAMPLE_ID=MMETSP0126 /ASSEMBLY_ACC=CAM_ASM_000229 /LENGTH=193 /DNA_ID=CAMNT_0017726239 /DNA_START=193 /DNA_END=774 /DNA_ORIENTATION=-